MGPDPPWEGEILRGKERSFVKFSDSLLWAEPIEMPFGIWTRVGPRKHVLCGDAHWRHLANAIEPSMFGGDAVKLLWPLVIIITDINGTETVAADQPTNKMYYYKIGKS